MGPGFNSTAELSSEDVRAKLRAAREPSSVEAWDPAHDEADAKRQRRLIRSTVTLERTVRVRRRGVRSKVRIQLRICLGSGRPAGSRPTPSRSSTRGNDRGDPEESEPAFARAHRLRPTMAAGRSALVRVPAPHPSWRGVGAGRVTTTAPKPAVGRWDMPHSTAGLERTHQNGLVR
jgi:hypothetical protein